MATEQLEEVSITLATVTSVISELKNQLQQQYKQAYPGLGDIIRYSSTRKRRMRGLCHPCRRICFYQT